MNSTQLLTKDTYCIEIIRTNKSQKEIKIEMFNCDNEYLKTVKKVVCIHPANHSVSLFLEKMNEADLAMYGLHYLENIGKNILS
jgi:hypothetical protein